VLPSTQTYYIQEARQREEDKKEEREAAPWSAQGEGALPALQAAVSLSLPPQR